MHGVLNHYKKKKQQYNLFVSHTFHWKRLMSGYEPSAENTWDFHQKEASSNHDRNKNSTQTVNIVTTSKKQTQFFLLNFYAICIYKSSTAWD